MIGYANFDWFNGGHCRQRKLPGPGSSQRLADAGGPDLSSGFFRDRCGQPPLWPRGSTKSCLQRLRARTADIDLALQPAHRVCIRRGALPGVAFPSGTAFLIASLLVVAVCNRLRPRVWWRPPLLSTVFSSVAVAAAFCVAAFVRTGMPWVRLAVGDYFFKVGFALLLLLPWRIIVAHGKTWRNPA